MVSAIQQDIIDETLAYIKKRLDSDSSGHDWWHVYRVWQTAIRIAEVEGGDSFTIQLAALLHDIADWKLNNGDEDIGPRLAEEWLQQCHVGKAVIDHVTNIIYENSFRGAGVDARPSSLEGMIVQDADRLDAIGAIGIARAFAFGGYKRYKMHDPDTKPTYHTSFDEYKNNRSSTTNHFFEKLLRLKDLMNTRTAQQIAVDRHKYMERFLERFFDEWQGTK